MGRTITTKCRQLKQNAVLWKLDKIENARNEINQLTEMENKPVEDTGSAIETFPKKTVITIWKKERKKER